MDLTGVLKFRVLVRILPSHVAVFVLYCFNFFYFFYFCMCVAPVDSPDISKSMQYCSSRYRPFAMDRLEQWGIVDDFDDLTKGGVSLL